MAQHVTGPHYPIANLLPLIEDGYQLLTPNLRLARRLRAEWDRHQAANGLKVWRPLPAQPLEAWLRQQWERRGFAEPALRRVPLDSGQALALWRRVITADQQQGDYQLLQADAAASLAQQARQHLLEWDCDLDDESLARELGLDPDCATFWRWCEAFNHALAGEGMATGADTIRLLADAGGQGGQRVALIEFHTLPPLYWRCLKALCERIEQPIPPAPAACTKAHTCPDRQRELQAVARWAREMHESQSGSIGIVLGDMRGDRAHLEYLLRREFGCLASDYNSLPVNFSTGWPLAEVPVVRDALAALAMTADQVSLSALTGLLRSRFLALGDRYSPASLQFIERLFNNGQDPLPLGAVRNLSLRAGSEQQGLRLGDILQDLAGRRELRQAAPPSVWAGRFASQLEAWGWPGEGALDSLEYQQVSEWHNLLEGLARFDTVCGDLSLADARQLLAQACRDTSFQPETADSRLQVLGPLEAAGLHFDHLWLVGMQASQWPAPARPNPFLPGALQRRLEMPHASAEREWDFATGLLDQYRRSTPNLYASYSRELDGAPELPSALLAGFDWCEPELPAPLPGDWTSPWEQGELETLVDHRAPLVGRDELAGVRGGAALLEDQSQCPFRAFARRRLQVEPLGEPGLGLSPAERGTLLHSALYALWGELGDAGQLAALDAEAEAEAALIGRAASAAVAALAPGRRLAVGPAYCDQEQHHLEGLLAEWLAVERERVTFVVAARETSLQLSLGELAVSLRVDRVDRLADGSVMIIDYKSGISRVGDWLGERPARPQLPLYSVGGDASVAALAFAQVRPRECKFVGLGDAEAAPGIAVDIPKAVRGRVPAETWDELRSHWQRALQRLADDFLAGAAAVDPLGPNSCTFCGLQPLCRVDIAALDPLETDRGEQEA